MTVSTLKTWADMAPGDEFVNGVFGLSTVESTERVAGITPRHQVLLVRHTLGSFRVGPWRHVHLDDGGPA